VQTISGANGLIMNGYGYTFPGMNGRSVKLITPPSSNVGVNNEQSCNAIPPNKFTACAGKSLRIYLYFLTRPVFPFTPNVLFLSSFAK
jgi:hypothetical protein